METVNPNEKNYKGELLSQIYKLHGKLRLKDKQGVAAERDDP